MITKLQLWEKEDQEYFVGTTAYNHVMSCLLNNKCVSVIGPPGVGKTFLVQHVALEMKKIGFHVISVSNPNEIKQNYKFKRKLLFVVDDMCGNFTANTTRLDLWKNEMKDLNHMLDKDTCKLILTCRLQVFQDEGFKHSDFKLFETCICNLIDDKLALTNSEKEKLATKYFNKTYTNELERLYKYAFFPLLCKLYDRDKDNSNFRLERFLNDPFDSYNEKLDDLFHDCKEGKYKFSALLLLVVCNNWLRKELLEGKNDSMKKLLKTIMEECGINERLTGKSLISQLDTLTGSYLVNENGVYHTIHDKLFDYLAYYFGTKNEATKTEFTELLIQHANKDFVLQRFQIKQTRRLDTEKEKDYVILIPDDRVLLYIKRVFNDMKHSQDIGRDIRNNRNRNNETFQKELQTFINKLNNDEITQLIKKASSDFVRGMFVVDKNDIHAVCDTEYSNFECPEYFKYPYVGIILDPDHFLEYIERIFVDLTNSDDVQNYILQCRNSRNDAFRSALLTLMTKCSTAQIKELIRKASYSVVQDMFVIAKEDVKKMSPRVYMRYGIEIPSDVIQVYIERVFDDITKSDNVNECIEGNRNRRNTIFNTKLLGYMSQLGGQQIKHLIETASRDFIFRLCVLTVDLIKESYDFEYERYGVVIPEDCTHLYIARVFDGLKTSYHTENYLKHNRNVQTKAFKTLLRSYIELLLENEIKHLIQTASSDFLDKWFVTRSEDIHIDSIIEYEQYGIILQGKNLQLYNEKMWTLMRSDKDFIYYMSCNRNTRYVLECINQLHISQITELIETINPYFFHQKILVNVQNELEEESLLDSQSLDNIDKTILKLKEGISKWPDSLTKQYMDRMVTDWSEGCLFAVIENVNMKNLSFVKKFVGHLNLLEPSKILDLVNGTEQYVEKCYFLYTNYTGNTLCKALTVCWIYNEVNLAKWCVESHCYGNGYEKHYNMCALFILVVFNDALEENTLLDETPKVKDVIMAFGRNHDNYEGISARLLCKALDTSMHGIVVKQNGVYHAINHKVFNCLLFYFVSMEHVLNTLIEYADVKILYRTFMRYSIDLHPKFIIDLPDRALQRCRERVFESMSKSNKNFKDVLAEYKTTFTWSMIHNFPPISNKYKHLNIEAVSIYNGNLQAGKIEILIKNSCIDFLSNCFLISIEEAKDDITVKCKPIIVLPDGCITVYIQTLFDNIIKSDCIEACIDENINKKMKIFHTTLSTFLKAFHKDDIKKLIAEASSDFVSRMFVISEEDIKYESYWEYERYGIVIPDNLLQMYSQRVLGDITHSIKVPENRNIKNKKFQDSIHSYVSSISEDELSSLIMTASSKFISHIFLSTEGDLGDFVSQRRECYFTFVSPKFFKLFKQHIPQSIRRQSSNCYFGKHMIQIFRFPDNSPTFKCCRLRQKNERRNVLLSVSFTNDKVIDNLNRHPTTRFFTNKTLNVYVRSSNSIVEQYMLRMIQDWNDGKVHDVIGNINLSNQSFQCKFIAFLKNTNNEKQTKLTKTNDIDTGDSPLAVCCYVGISKLAEWCLENNSDTNSTNNYGEHPLYIACYHMHHDIVQLLLNHKNKPDVNMRTKYLGKTPFYLACKKGLTTIVSHLLNAEVDVNCLCDKKTPLFVACKYGHNDIVSCLLELKKHKINVNNGKLLHLNVQMTPLFIACKYGHNKIVKLLLEQNQDTIYINKGEEIDKKIRTPLYIACKGGHTECVALLLNHTFDEVDVNKPTFTGETPLYTACEGGYKDIVSLLLAHESQGINISKHNGSTSLFVACQKGHDEVVSTLLKQKVIDIHKCMISGMSPLFIASLLGYKKIAKMLLSRNADINIWIRNKDTVKQVFKELKELRHERHIRLKENAYIEEFIKPICKLICDNVSEPVKSYIERSEENWEEHWVTHFIFGSTPLHVGSLMGHTEIVSLFVDKNFNINCFSENGSTPLFLACELGHEDIVRVLLDKKANPLLERKDGKSPLSIATENGHLKIVDIILQAVKVNINHSESTSKQTD